jgi:glycosyltransferase involved in cell wall biosynthesis
MHVIHNGVDLAHPVAAARMRTPVIAVVANINGYKGHEPFLDVVALVRDRVPDVGVLYIGRNDLGASIVRAIESRGLASTVKLLGYHARPDEIVRNVRVLALPSPQIEGCPTAVLEAMSMGVPVVAYTVGGLLEIVTQGQSGFLIRPGDTKGFASALVDLLLDTELNDRIGAEARRVVASRFSLQACTRLHAELWHSLTHRIAHPASGSI